MIQFEKPAGWKCLELGCGANPHPLSDVRVDVRAVPGVTHFTINFDAPEWPEIGDNDFEMVLGIFCLEHISWRCLPNALRQINRILKPGGKALFLVPNTEAQIQWIAKRGWTKKDKNDGDFVEASRILMGDLDYPENGHKLYFSPSIVMKLFSEAGFVNITTLPFGEIQTDLIIEASKEGILPTPTQPPPEQPSQPSQPSVPPLFQPKKESPKELLPSLFAPEREGSKKTGGTNEETSFSSVPPSKLVQQGPSQLQKEEGQDPAPLSPAFNRDYFNHYQGGGFYWDYPNNEVIFRKILERDPQSVLELGCARGYVLKKIQDKGIPVCGLDLSQHAYLTRVCDSVRGMDVTHSNWQLDQKYDLALSICLLEHIPEQQLAALVQKLSLVSQRGLHAVVVQNREPNQDKTRCNLKSLDYWRSILPTGHEVVDYTEFSAGQVPPDYLVGDGRLKLNIGSAWTMFHNGWLNVDVIDGDGFAKSFQYNFRKHDVTTGFPFISTGVVDLIFSSHMLEHLNYEDGLRFLRECRRIIRPSGGMRLVVPDSKLLCKHFYDVDDAGALRGFDEVNEACAHTVQPAAKLWSLLAEGHKSFYDHEMLDYLLRESGWHPHSASFRQTSVLTNEQILKEGIEMSYGLSLFMDATPL